jgi:predicted DNA-binding protein with PD1-like motif
MEQTHAVRLLPGEDLKGSIEKIVRDKQIEAGWIAACVGSLACYSIRFANSKDRATGEGSFEIVSLSGTLSRNGCHLHIAIADIGGNVLGGHLMEGSRIYTTAEIVIVSRKRFRFTRTPDAITGFNELHIDLLSTDGA